MKELKVGSFIYRRNGKPVEIVGETRVSWVLKSEWSWEKPEKVSKKMLASPDIEQWQQFFANKQDAEDAVFVQNHRHLIGNAVGTLLDPIVLRNIANLIGYKEDKQ